MADEFMKGFGILTGAGLVWMVLAGWYQTPSFFMTNQLIRPPAGAGQRVRCDLDLPHRRLSLDGAVGSTDVLDPDPRPGVKPLRRSKADANRANPFRSPFTTAPGVATPQSRGVVRARRRCRTLHTITPTLYIVTSVRDELRQVTPSESRQRVRLTHRSVIESAARRLGAIRVEIYFSQSASCRDRLMIDTEFRPGSICRLSVL